MPIYEYECKEHGKFERLFQNVTECPQMNCPICFELSDRIWSLTAMQPDTLWSGVNTQQGYFTSKKQRLNYLRENNIERVERGMIEDVQKKSANKIQEFKEKSEKRVEKFLEKELASA